MDKKVWQLIVTYERDLKFLEYNLKSFRKYCTGFAGTIIVVPMSQVDKFMYLEKMFGQPDSCVWISGFMEYPGKGFVHHLAMKMYADVIMPEATHILHTDPDCLWTRPTTPDDYFVDGKPVLVVEPYNLLKLYFKGRYDWKAITEESLGFDCEYETMCRHPAVHLKELYPAVRACIEARHRTPFTDFYLRHPNKFNYGVGEFNELGSYAIKHLRDKYHIHDCGPERLQNLAIITKDLESKIGHPEMHLKQMWSYQGTEFNMAEINRILA